MYMCMLEFTEHRVLQDDRETGEEDSATEVAEILLRLQDNLHVNPRSRRYTTRTATGACHLERQYSVRMLARTLWLPEVSACSYMCPKLLTQWTRLSGPIEHRRGTAGDAGTRTSSLRKFRRE